VTRLVEPLRLRHHEADAFAPDGSPLVEALSRTTDLGVGAHPDDLELFAVVPIGHCHDDPRRWFSGVTCTDGSGSARGARFAHLAPHDLVALRREEQRTAARLGGYSTMIQLAHPSGEVRVSEGFDVLVDELASVIEATRPANVYTHNLADKHPSHVAVGAATVRAVRRLPADRRPGRLVGIEAWRDLDWLPDAEKVRMDATPFTGLARRLARVYESQIDGAKRYDVAVQGRRRANATLFDMTTVDDVEEVAVAMDLTSLLRNDDLDPVSYVTAAIDRFRADVEASLRPYFS
jgi:LmbE family N-acetylglucosaminyl deacetylase